MTSKSSDTRSTPGTEPTSRCTWSWKLSRSGHPATVSAIVTATSPPSIPIVANHVELGDGLAQLGVDHPAERLENGFASGLHGCERSNGAMIRRAAMLPPQPNFLTLACRDVERMAGFLRALGWPEAPGSEPAHRVFQGSNGVVVALYGAENHERHFGPRAEGFRGFTLGVNVGSAGEVDSAYDALREVEGAELLGEPADSPHGFRGFSFRDPEGNLWDVVYAFDSTVAADGSLTWSA